MDNKNYLWGKTTQSSLQIFPLQGYNPVPEILIYSVCKIKLAAAIVHQNNCKLPLKVTEAIIESCNDILSKKNIFNELFPLSIWQSGSGTQTNMNVNEVIANLACKKLGYEINRTDIVHPNDHVNFGQSTNDSIPTAIRLSTLIEIKNKLIPALKILSDSFEQKFQEWKYIVKSGRTHLQDAVPMTLGQEFESYKQQIKSIKTILEDNLHLLYEIPQGGTAVGTGINSYKGFDQQFVKELSEITKLPLSVSENKFSDISSHGDLLVISGIINSCASCIYKIVQDISLLLSGPNCGLNELYLREQEQPGSSIMPGKTNPIHAEIIKMACINTMSNHCCITQCNTLGNLQLNTNMPLIAYKILDSIHVLSESIKSFVEHNIELLEPNTKYIKSSIENSFIMITALTPKIGYDKASKVVLEANKREISIKDLLINDNLISEKEWEELSDLSKLVEPK